MKSRKAVGATRHIHQPPASPVTNMTLMVGTAGHVDHGKTALVKCLTGCDTDRLPEEKARGMTIDLGFAACTLGSDRRVGIIDVPGHERFVHNMVAGAAGVDVLLLVVAADDGVMPQTIEHFHIARLMGIRSGFVAITKIDLVPAGRVEEVRAEIEVLTAGSFLQGCTIVPVSSKTGEGFDAFFETFTHAVERGVQRQAAGPFRMHVERVFVLQGRGAVVTGVPRSGAVRPGDTVAVLPGGETLRVREVQVYGTKAEQGVAGECVALNISGIESGEVTRGAMLAAPGYFEATTLVNARFQLLPHLSKPLQPRTAVRFHVGTADVPGHLVLPELEPMLPGAEAYVQLQLQRPVVAVPGDPFVVRQLSPVTTIGGGYVVAPDHMRMRRTRGQWLERCREQDNAMSDPVAGVRYVIARADRPLRDREIAHAAGLSETAVAEPLRELAEAGEAIPVGDRYLHVEHMQAAETALADALAAMHDKRPLSMGFPKKELFNAVDVEGSVAETALQRLRDSGKVGDTRAGCHLAERLPRLNPRQAAMGERICETYRRAAFSAPRRDELPGLLGAPAPILDPIIDHLVQRGDLLELSDKVILHSDHVESARDKLVRYLEQNGELETPTFKDMVGSTRKYAIALLEYWDGQGLTRRVGNVRRLRSAGRSDS